MANQTAPREVADSSRYGDFQVHGGRPVACRRGAARGGGLISVWDLVEGSRDTLRARGEALEQIPWVSEPAEAGTVAWRARQAAHGAVGGRIWRTVVYRPNCPL